MCSKVNRTKSAIFMLNRDISEENLEEDPEMSLAELSEKLNLVLEQLTRVTTKQGEHEQVLTYLNGKLEEPKEQIKEFNIDLFRIPDSIKSIPSFDGNRKQLSAWLKTCEDTLSVFSPLVTEPQLRLYVQAVCNKIEGKAKDILCLAGNPQNFDEIKQILTDALGDKQELSF